MADKIVAFICTHNACRSQIAEALARHAGYEGYEFFSAGSDPLVQIDPNAVRIMKEKFGIDMHSQRSKTIRDIPAPDIAISMGCGVKCPYDDDWGMEDPTGKPDEVYLKVIGQIQERLKETFGEHELNLKELFDRHFSDRMTPARYRLIFANTISRSVMDTPIGPLRIFASGEAVLGVEPAERERADAGTEAGKIPADRILPGDASGELVKACEAELKEYFAGERRAFDLPVNPEGTEFQKNVWSHLQQIPYGETRTYGQLAAMVGNAKASRAVGMANHCNPIMILIPCHRVIGADGSLTGYAAGIEAKKFLLQLEKRYTE
jgi:O-6-methylguanine DNA methyltransferase